jgi:hypothetical protein
MAWHGMASFCQLESMAAQCPLSRYSKEEERPGSKWLSRLIAIYRCRSVMVIMVKLAQVSTDGIAFAFA